MIQKVTTALAIIFSGVVLIASFGKHPVIIVLMAFIYLYMVSHGRFALRNQSQYFLISLYISISIVLIGIIDHFSALSLGINEFFS